MAVNDEDSPPLHSHRRGPRSDRTGSSEESGDLDPLQDTQILFRRAVSGDERAIDLLYQRYIRRVEAWARGRVPSHARDVYDTEVFAQEIVVKTLMKAVESHGSIRTSFRAYVRRAIENRLIDLHRRSQIPTEPLDEEMGREEPTELELLVEAEFERDLAGAIAQLEPAQAHLLRMRFQQEWSYGTIASALGLASEDTARMRVNRVLQILRNRLDERDASGR